MVNGFAASLIGKAPSLRRTLQWTVVGAALPVLAACSSSLLIKVDSREAVGKQIQWQDSSGKADPARLKADQDYCMRYAGTTDMDSGDYKFDDGLFRHCMREKGWKDS
jgi:hypothetical protein